MKETCENCGRRIGKLETAHVFDGHVVCDQCHLTLEGNRTRREIGYAAVAPTADGEPTQRERSSEQKEQSRRFAGGFAIFGLMLALCAGVVFETMNNADLAMGLAVLAGFVTCIGVFFFFGASWLSDVKPDPFDRQN